MAENRTFRASSVRTVWGRDLAPEERRCEAEGGTEKEELRELVAEVRELLESGQTLEKGCFARFNDKLKQYP